MAGKISRKYNKRTFGSVGAKKSYGKSAMQKRKSYGSYIGKKKFGNNNFKKFAERVLTAASEAKKMTCRIGCGGLSNVPFGSVYLTPDQYDALNERDRDSYRTRQNPCVPGIVSHYIDWTSFDFGQ